jgi:uncharacterized protein with GYD domain
MPTYIMLFNFTQQRVTNIKDMPKGVDAFKRDLQQVGGQLKGFYMVTGEYDTIAIVEAPSDEAIAKLALTTAALGNVRTKTMRGFTEDEFREIIAALP